MMDLHKHFKITTFPGGEINLKINEIPKDDFDLVDLVARLRGTEDVMSLLLAVDAIRRTSPKTYLARLTIPYFPYARQDRVCNEGESLSLKVMADLINSLKVPEVVVLDPHSDVLPALLDNVKVIDRTEIVNKVLSNYVGEGYTIICPDAGALKQTYKIAEKVFNTSDVYCCNKRRNTETGQLKVGIDYLNWSGKKCIIVDDICDGGGTFIQIAEKLKACGAEEVILYVTHGIFSKGLRTLSEHIDKIYTTDSFSDINNSLVETIEVERILDEVTC
jgi:ribose-phosphate pyrophosphokinase